jgi:hypothetical protein
MDAKSQARQRRKRELVQELAELQLEEMVEAGDFDQTPHFGLLERAASEFGKQLARETLERASREAITGSQAQASCPICGTLCDVTTKCRTVKSVDGPIMLTEAVADCRQCRRSFFPSTDSDGAR